MRGIVATVLLALSVVPTASAQMVESSIVASNGLAVKVSTDEFAGRKEYSSGEFDIQGSGRQRGQFMVAKIIRPGQTARLSIQGFVTYSGDWHRYDSAIFKGGEAVEFTNIDRDVISCRYGCSYSESFIAFPTPQQIKKYAEGTIVPIQVRGENSANTLLLQIPLSIIAAVEEVAK
ncbi:hypothetical protein [Sphingobium lactosutens]|nr:hypothetical protein [Sphingobium lactosutens]